MRRARLAKLAATMLMALVFSTIMAVPAFAQTYMTDTDGGYTQGAESTYTTTSAVNVTVTIEDKVSSSAAIDYVQIPVSLPAVSDGKAYTVRDALMAVNNTPGTAYKFLDTYGNEIDTGDHYFKYVQYNNTNYGPSNDTITYDGWCFRINGKLPLESGTKDDNPLGSVISNTYLTNGDQINVYFDDLYDGVKENRFTKINSVTYDGSAMTVNVKFAYDWFTPVTYAWHIYDYDNYGLRAITVKLLDSTGDEKASGKTDANGNVALSISNLSGTYTVYAVGQSSSVLVHAQTSDKVQFTV